MFQTIQKVELVKPNLRLYENFLAEIENFDPPEGLRAKSDFLRYLSHPAIILRVLPDKAFQNGPRTLPLQL